MTSTDLLTKIKLWTAAPNQQPAFSNTEYLSILDDEMMSNIVPFIMKANEDYFIDYYDYTLGSTSAKYAIPSQAIASKIREIKIIAGDDKPENYINVPRFETEDIGNYDFGFYFDNMHVHFIDTNGEYAGATLRIYYFRRPNKLTQTTYAAKISSITGNTATCESVPTSIITGSVCDVVQGKNPYQVIGESLAVTVSSNTIELTMPSEAVAGDYICLTGYSPVANIPEEIQPLLIQAGVLKCLEILNDTNGTEKAIAKYAQLAQTVQDIITPRATGELKRITSNNSFV